MKPKLIKYTPAWIRVNEAKRLKTNDPYRYRMYNSVNKNKVHIYDSDTGEIVCGSELGCFYQFRTESDTINDMEGLQIGQYCKKCLSRCEIINE